MGKDLSAPAKFPRRRKIQPGLGIQLWGDDHSCAAADAELNNLPAGKADIPLTSAREFRQLLTRYILFCSPIPWLPLCWCWAAGLSALLSLLPAWLEASRKGLAGQSHSPNTSQDLGPFWSLDQGLAKSVTCPWETPSLDALQSAPEFDVCSFAVPVMPYLTNSNVSAFSIDPSQGYCCANLE